jgi:formylglycine-generating enzyme required for sulfatase activity
VTAAVLKRGESVADKAPDSALKDYETALSLGASVSEPASLKGQLVTALTARCRQSLAGQDIAKASADYATVMKLDSLAAGGLTADFAKLPADVLPRIPTEFFVELAPERNSIGMDLKLIPPGTFTMGSNSGLSYSYEKPQHQVELTKFFYLGTTEVTQRQYERVMGANPSHFQNMKKPVENVSWHDAVEFCRKLSNLPEEKSAHHVYRLPSEAEWEYACRAETKTAYSIGDNTANLGEYAWFKTNSAEVTHVVGQKQPNAWGLYDMHGNVWEWCQDLSGDYSSGSIQDPKGPKVGTLRVYRGGSWHDESKFLRSAYRGQIEAQRKDKNVGFRVARTHNQTAGSGVSRLRAAAFKAEGEQKEKSGDLSGAVAAFDEAVKLDSSLGLKTERAMLHVKLGEQAVAKQDYAAAATELDSAVSLGAPASDSASLKTKLVTALTARCRQSLAGQDMAKASADYASVAKLDSQAASSLVADFEKLPASVLSQLPPRKNTLGMTFKLLPGGTFTMGEGNETPHQVTLTKPFELGVYEVTQEQYEAVTGTNPSNFKGPQNPVEKVSWDDAVEFCRKLSERPEEKLAGYVYRLPTEAEWEYACRAGTTTAYSFGDSASELGDYAWYNSNSGSTTHPDGGKKPNAWGLYDMHGNVFEWCQDWHGDYPSRSVTDPTGAAVGSLRVYRGGSWFNYSDYCRSGYRYRFSPVNRDFHLGFRVLRSSIK